MITGACLCGALKWTFEGPLTSATACNCTACRRYGSLWAYGHEGEDIKFSGPSASYCRQGKQPALHFHFCPTCGGLSHYRGVAVNDKGQRKVAVNLRMAEQPEQVQALLIDHFDGLVTFSDLPSDGKCVRDLWF